MNINDEMYELALDELSYAYEYNEGAEYEQECRDSF